MVRIAPAQTAAGRDFRPHLGASEWNRLISIIKISKPIFDNS